MIRFFYQAGSARTNALLFEHIKQDLKSGAEVLLLVPEQQTVSTERRMLRLLSEEKSFSPEIQLRFEVLNFSRLADLVFRKRGGYSWNVATPAVRALSMWKALRNLEDQLLQYGKQALNPRLCTMMLDIAAQCKAYQISSTNLLEAAEDKQLKDAPLKAKLTDIGTVLAAFEQTLKTKFENGDNDLDRLAEKLWELHSEAKSGNGDTAQLFSNTHVYVDSFTDYTAQELEVLKALIEITPCVSFTTPLAHEKEEGPHLYSAQRSLLQLKALAKTAPKAVLSDTKAPTTAREYVVRHLFDMDAVPTALPQTDIKLQVCATPFSEAEAAAAEIHRLIREKKDCHYRDIAIVLRDANSRLGILDATLEREGIPFFLSEKTDVTVHPLVKLILLALRVVLHNFRDEDVVAYMKTGLCGVAADDVNFFEEYAAVWHPRTLKNYTAPFTRNPDGYATALSARAARILEGANRARETVIQPLADFCGAMQAATSATQMCQAVYALLCTLAVSEQMKGRAEHLLAGKRNSDRRTAQELTRLWAVTVQALEDVSRTIGEESVSVAEFIDAIKLVFANTDMGSIPTSADAVTIGSASMLRADHPRFVLVLGLNEGDFPASIGDTGLLSDYEKDLLAQIHKNAKFPSTREKRTSDELFYVYRAFSAPHEALYLSLSKTATDGRAAVPSIAFDRTCTLLKIKIKELPLFEEAPALSHIYTKAAALDRMCYLNAEEKKELMAYLRAHNDPIMQTIEKRVIDPEANLLPETAQELLEKELSPSHLESFSSCKFAYYCEKVLKLREDKYAELGLSDTGTFLHYVLEHVMKQRNKTGKDFKAFTDAEIKRMVTDITASYLQMLVDASGTLTPRAEALTKRLEALAQLVVSSLFAEFSDSDFIPAFVELKLKEEKSSDKVTLADNIDVSLKGTADRVDVWKTKETVTDENGTVREIPAAYLRVVDYKTGTRKFSPEDVKHGFSLQMPLYLSALTSRAYPTLNKSLSLPLDTKLKPAGVTYFSTSVKSENTDARVDAETAMRNAASRLGRSGILLDDPKLLQAASHIQDTAIIGKSDDDKGRSKVKTRLSADEIKQMLQDLSDTVTRLHAEMRAGKATASPNPHKFNSPCNYCKFKAICRADKVSVAPKKGD